jgi:hypothetical protein
LKKVQNDTPQVKNQAAAEMDEAKKQTDDY